MLGSHSSLGQSRDLDAHLGDPRSCFPGEVAVGCGPRGRSRWVTGARRTGTRPPVTAQISSTWHVTCDPGLLCLYVSFCSANDQNTRSVSSSSVDCVRSPTDSGSGVGRRPGQVLRPQPQRGHDARLQGGGGLRGGRWGWHRGRVHSSLLHAPHGPCPHERDGYPLLQLRRARQRGQAAWGPTARGPTCWALLVPSPGPGAAALDPWRTQIGRGPCAQTLPPHPF